MKNFKIVRRLGDVLQVFTDWLRLIALRNIGRIMIYQFNESILPSALVY